MSMGMKEQQEQQQQQQQQPVQEKKVGHLKKFVDYIREKAQKLFFQTWIQLASLWLLLKICKN